MAPSNKQLHTKFFSTMVATCMFGAAMVSVSAEAATKTANVPSKVQRPSEHLVLPLATPLVQMDTALRFVLVTGIHKNLSLLLLDSVKSQPVVKDAIDRHGMDRVQSTVVQAIRAAKSAHAQDWNEMLAGIYTRHFTAAELQSIMADREASPHFGQLVKKQALIAAEAHIQGQNIFAEAKSDVMEDIQQAIQ